MTSLFANSLQPLDLCFWLAAHQSSLCPSHDGRSFAYQFSSCSHEDYFTSLCRQRKPTKLSNSLDSAIQPQTAGGVTDRGWANEGAGANTVALDSGRSQSPWTASLAVRLDSMAAVALSPPIAITSVSGVGLSGLGHVGLICEARLIHHTGRWGSGKPLESLKEKERACWTSKSRPLPRSPANPARQKVLGISCS